MDEQLRLGTLQRLGTIDVLVSDAVSALHRGSAAIDPLKGLFITPDHAEEIASAGREGPLRSEPAAAMPEALDAWGSAVGLDDTDIDLLLAALAPDLDRRYEQLYGYLHDDISLRRATIGLALRVTGNDPTDPTARRRFGDRSALVGLGLIEFEDRTRPFLSRSLRVPDRVVSALLGDDQSDPDVRVVDSAAIRNEWTERLAASLSAGVGLVHVVDSSDGTAVSLVSSALVASIGVAVVVSPDERSWADVLVAGTREAALRSGGLVVESIEMVVGAEPAIVNRLASLPRPVVLIGRGPWNPEWSMTVPLTIEAPVLEPAERARVWQDALNGHGDFAEIEQATVAFRLGPDRIRRAAQAAAHAARHQGTTLGSSEVQLGARQQNSDGLQRLAHRIVPSVTWEDLILDSDALSLVHEVAARVRHRSRVLDEWGLRRGGGRGDGITALFSGPSGTGKTLAAEVIAHDLGVELHTIDLATVVDKYIGETEKNLDRIFVQAEQVNTVLFFDEADALFGKRSEVKDARDRYANIEVAYLLQRMERFNGLVVLATNLQLNIDDAFARRLDVTVDFPKPEPGERRRLWVRLLGDDVPTDATVDLAFLADAFELSGGNIRSAVVTAAFLAAAAERPVGMVDLVNAVGREYRKLGRLCLESEFGAWFFACEVGGAGDLTPAH